MFFGDARGDFRPLEVFDLTDFSRVLGKRRLEGHQDTPRCLFCARPGDPLSAATGGGRRTSQTHALGSRGGCRRSGAQVSPHSPVPRAPQLPTSTSGGICFSRSFSCPHLFTLISALLGRHSASGEVASNWFLLLTTVVPGAAFTPAAPVGEPFPEVFRRWETPQ